MKAHAPRLKQRGLSSFPSKNKASLFLIIIHKPNAPSLLRMELSSNTDFLERFPIKWEQNELKQTNECYFLKSLFFPPESLNVHLKNSIVTLEITVFLISKIKNETHLLRPLRRAVLQEFGQMDISN